MAYFRAGRLCSHCCVEGLRGNHIKFRPRRKPLPSSLKRPEPVNTEEFVSCTVRCMQTGRYQSPTPPPQRPEEQTTKTAETHDSNPCASINIPNTCTLNPQNRLVGRKHRPDRGRHLCRQRGRCLGSIGLLDLLGSGGLGLLGWNC